MVDVQGTEQKFIRKEINAKWLGIVHSVVKRHVVQAMMIKTIPYDDKVSFQ